ncbi:hypothetical protein PoB_000390000 [Plakobranchus ocellatus]|uniref:Uncharacterized protein n=1 Tax=Plakobranchus ocellatus TaxID=259542 RepID=A0AAV3Y402_9GAST|nr:hypothetical protein PoB_000390000 [Plakobranchus ocellatus]
MIRKLSHESPSGWNCFVPAALFAYRSQVHSSTEFSPFFLLFGRAPGGPMQILCDIFLNKDFSGETSFQYHYVIDLHNRIRKDWRFVQDSVRDSVDESRLRHELKSKLKHFVPEPTVYVSAISEEDGGEIGSLVTTPPLASESGTVVIDPSLSSSQFQDVKELLMEFQDILTFVPGCTSTL